MVGEVTLRTRVGATLAVLSAVGALVAGCASTTSTKTSLVAADAQASQAAARQRLPLLPIPPGSTAWPANTDGPMKLVPFIAGFYIASARSEEASAYAQDGFVSGEIEGWTNQDGSRASIIVARFATSDGAISEFNGFSGEFGLDPFSQTIFADQVNGAVGDADPQRRDASGFLEAEIVDHVGDYLVDVRVYTPGPPDTADATTLLRQELKALAAAPASA
jgi:hypothetical protein